MDYLTPFDFAQLKAFFSALKQSNFNLKQIPSSVVLDGEKTPINKPHCLELLRSFPELSGEQFKDDTFLAKFLTKPDNVKRILSHLPVTEQNELTKIVETLPVAIGDDSTQTGGQQAPAEQVPPAGAGTGTMSMPGMPSTPSISFRPRRMIRKIPASGMEGGTGTGTAVTNKAAGLTAKEPKIAQRFNWRGFNTPNSFKNFGSAAGRFFKTNSTRIAGGFGEMAKGVGRGIVNPGLTGTYNLLGKAGTRGINVFARFSNQVPGRSTFARGSSKKIVWAFLGLLLLTGLLTAFAPPSPSSSTSPTIPPTGPVSDISSCKFTRANVSASYTSPLLLSYISEASTLSGVPPAILAAFIRVESPSSVNMSDEQIKNYAASCPVSPTGALGIMQIQPPGSTSARGDPASCDDCIDAGARLIGKTVQDMARADYCDPRTSIIVASGWILKKMSYLGYQNTGQWNPTWTSDPRAINALVNTYYGCLQYGGTSDCTGPYNYGTDVYTGAQNCQTQSSPPPGGGSGPVPTEKLAQISYWAGKINNALERGLPSSSWNRMVQNITNGTYTATTRTAQDRGVGPTGIYWCTNIVIDSYNLSSIFGLGPNHQGVRSMMNFWQNTNGYFYIAFDQKIIALQHVKPGYAVFRIHPNDYNFDHVSMISYIEINARGDGEIRTLDSNGSRSWSSPISGGVPTDNSFLSPIVGFGGITE